MNTNNNEISPVGSIFMHPSISTELYYLMEYNPESALTRLMWQREGAAAIQLSHSNQQLNIHHLMIFILTISGVFLHHWIWLDAI